MEDKVNFRHFSPNRNECAVGARLMKLIEELAPSDSYIQAFVDKVSDGTYKAIITVKALCGNFSCECSDLSPEDSLRTAQKSVLKSLDEWKQHRFSAVAP
jgi:hypothetical protein